MDLPLVDRSEWVCAPECLIYWSSGIGIATNVLCLDGRNGFHAICYNDFSCSRSHTNPLWMQIDRMFLQDTHNCCCFPLEIRRFVKMLRLLCTHSVRLILLQKQSTSKRIEFSNEINSFGMVIFGSLWQKYWKERKCKEKSKTGWRYSTSIFLNFVWFFRKNYSIVSSYYWLNQFYMDLHQLNEIKPKHIESNG